jgi:GT2 family glycosyltransferase
MSDEPFVYIISLNWNGLAYLRDFCETILKQDYGKYKVVIVDNASTDASVEFLRENYPQIEVLQNSTNLGYAAGNNVGLEYAYKAGAAYFLVMNNDTIVPPDMIASLVEVSLKDSKIGFVTGKVYFHDSGNMLQTAGKRDKWWRATIVNVGQNELDHGQFDEEQDYDYLDDVFWLVKREVYERIGGYDPEFFLYWEETDWCARAKGSGFRLVYTPKAKLYHKISLSTGGGSNPKKSFHVRRNAVLFYWRHKSKPVFFLKLFLIVREIFDWRRVAAFFIKGKYGENFRAEWRGFVDGLKYVASGKFK